MSTLRFTAKLPQYLISAGAATARRSTWIARGNFVSAAPRPLQVSCNPLHNANLIMCSKLQIVMHENAYVINIRRLSLIAFHRDVDARYIRKIKESLE